jgi:DNA-binding LacI/PurR family transcriptional regulator
MPLVWIHSIPIDIEVNSVSVNQEKGMKIAMEYLLSLGHKKIAYVTGEKGYSYTLKQQLWKEALTQAGFPPAQSDLITVERTDFIDGIKTTKEAVSAYLAKGNHPTAIFCANDIMAMGTMNALSEAGLRVPDDVSIMSHDNTVFADSMNFTCVDMKIKSVAIAAMDLLDYAMNGSDKTPRHITIIPELVIRKSCRKI